MELAHRQYTTLIRPCMAIPCSFVTVDYNTTFSLSGCSCRDCFSCEALSPYSHTYCHTYYYWYSITHSLFHSRLKSFLFCKSSLPQPFLFLIQVSLYGFPRLFTLLLSISVFSLFSFSVFTLFSCRFRAVD